MSAVEEAASRLEAAMASGVPCEPLTDLLGTDIDRAYETGSSQMRV